MTIISYRYTLTRSWSTAPNLLWIMLNPSEADRWRDDPTVRRVKDFSLRFGYGGCTVANVFAARATKPEELRPWIESGHAIGPNNDTHIRELMKVHPKAIAAWGAFEGIRERTHTVRRIAELTGCELHALTITKQGHPGHPLYISKDTHSLPYPLLCSCDPRFPTASHCTVHVP